MYRDLSPDVYLVLVTVAVTYSVSGAKRLFLCLRSCLQVNKMLKDKERAFTLIEVVVSSVILALFMRAFTRLLPSSSL